MVIWLLLDRRSNTVCCQLARQRTSVFLCQCSLHGAHHFTVHSTRIRWLSRRSIACGETAGHSALGTKKLRSSNVDFRYGQTDVAAPQLHHRRRRFPRARALGYLPQPLRSQSHPPPDRPPIDGCTPIDPQTHCCAAHCASTKCSELTELR